MAIDWGEQLDAADNLINEHAAALGSVVDEVLSGSEYVVRDSGNAVDSLVSEILGSADNTLDPHFPAVGRVLDTLTTGVNKTLDQHTDAISTVIAQVMPPADIAQVHIDTASLPPTVVQNGSLPPAPTPIPCPTGAGTCGPGVFPDCPDPVCPPGQIAIGEQETLGGSLVYNCWNPATNISTQATPIPCGVPPTVPPATNPPCPCQPYSWLDDPRHSVDDHGNDYWNGDLVENVSPGNPQGDLPPGAVQCTGAYGLIAGQPGLVYLGLLECWGADGAPIQPCLGAAPGTDLCNPQSPPAPPMPPPQPPMPPPQPPQPPPLPLPPPPGQCCPPQQPPVVNVYPQSPPCPVPPTSPPAAPPTVPPPKPPPPPPPRPAPTENVQPVPISTLKLDWTSADLCSVLPSTLGSLPQQLPDGTQVLDKDSGLPGWMQWLRRAGRTITSTVLGSEFETVQTSDNIKRYADELGLEYTEGSVLVDRALKAIGIYNLQNPGSTVYLGSVLAAANWGEQKTGYPASYLCNSHKYAFQYLNPQYIPEQDGVDRLWLTGRIDGDTWTCLTRANGNMPTWYQPLAQTKVGRPDIRSLVELRLRGAFTDNGLYDRAKDIGWNNFQYVDEMVKLAYQLPTQDSQIRYLVRDSWDNNIVTKYGYDQDFDTKFQKNPGAQALAQATGVDPNYLRMEWWAHWVIPSNTQLYDMLHRFRPDRPERVIWERTNPRPNDPNGNPVDDWTYYHMGPSVVTRAMVKEALEVNDNAPGFVQYLLDLSYRPITNTDASRAFLVGAFDRGQMIEAFLNNGYSPGDAKLLGDFYALLKVQRLANETGVLTKRDICQRYMDGSLDRPTSYQLLLDQMGDQQAVFSLLQRCDAKVSSDYLRAKIKELRKQFLTAGIEASDALVYLDIAGVQAGKAQALVSQWDWERTHAARNATASMLCKWRYRNLITPEEHFRRLRVLGFSIDDANRIAQVCVVERAEVVARQQATLARQQLKDTEHAIKILIALYPELAAVLAPYTAPSPPKPPAPPKPPPPPPPPKPPKPPPPPPGPGG